MTKVPDGGIFCSLVIPCYNEEGNLTPLAEGFAAALGAPSGPGDFELILVDNGSSDGTAAALRALAARFPFLRAVTVPVNKGYGYGITQGLGTARGEYAGWAHGDLQYSPAEIMKAVELLRPARGKKIFLKGLRGARPLTDRFFTAGMAAFESLLFGARFRDINAQPTLFHRSLLEHWDGAPADFSLDLYAYALALGKGFAVKRLALTLGERAHGLSSWNRGFLARLRITVRYVKSSPAVKRAVDSSAAGPGPDRP
ncbi:MAG: glycosyl transferase family 2 [Elusimicrobia bacterium CG08_land_8_20_14_0_20_59_10]|nr:MAG: glycosyl transferase family 2 [Elusimicrobia bacterium CG08_land_8_20_14_0_20_59_10]